MLQGHRLGSPFSSSFSGRLTLCDPLTTQSICAYQWSPPTVQTMREVSHPAHYRTLLALPALRRPACLLLAAALSRSLNRESASVLQLPTRQPIPIISTINGSK